MRAAVARCAVFLSHCTSDERGNDGQRCECIIQSKQAEQSEIDSVQCADHARRRVRC